MFKQSLILNKEWIHISFESKCTRLGNIIVTWSSFCGSIQKQSHFLIEGMLKKITMVPQSVISMFSSSLRSDSGGALDRGDPAGEELHPSVSREHSCQHAKHWTFLFHVSQHQWHLQVDGAACQHCHAPAPRQWGICCWPFTPQTMQNAQERLCAQEVSLCLLTQTVTFYLITMTWKS